MKQCFEAFGMLVLVLAGLGGVTYNLFRDDGWLEKALGRAFSYAMESPLVLGLMVVVTASLVFWWRHDQRTRGHHGKGPTFVLYTVIGAGAYFLGKLAVFHSL